VPASRPSCGNRTRRTSAGSCSTALAAASADAGVLPQDRRLPSLTSGLLRRMMRHSTARACGVGGTHLRFCLSALALLDDTRSRLDRAMALQLAKRSDGKMPVSSLANAVLPRTGEGESITALHLAARSGSGEVAAVLLESGADHAVVDSRGRTPLSFAAAAGHGGIAKMLLDAQAKVDNQDSLGWSALHHAACAGQAAVCTLLVERGADVSLLTGEGMSALHLAAQEGKPACVKALAQAGARVDSTGSASLRRSCLDVAVRHGKLGCVAALLQLGADARVVDGDGNTPLNVAASKGEPLALRALLPKSDLGVANAQGLQAFHTAAACGQLEALRLLLPLCDVHARTSKPASGSAATAHDLTALHLACKAGQAGAVAELLAAGAQRDALDSQRRSALHYAAWFGRLDALVGIVGEPGAYVLHAQQLDAQDALGRTPLWFAAAQGHAECCAALISAGASVTAGAQSPCAAAKQFQGHQKELLAMLQAGKIGGEAVE